MADEGLDIKIKATIDDAGSAKTLTGLKKSMKELKDLTQEVGEGSEDFKKLSKAIAEGQDKINNLKDSVQTLQGSGIEKLNSSLGLLTEGLKNADPGKIGVAFKAMGAAMAAIPIFLLIEGLKLLWDNLDKVIGFLNGSTKALKAANDAYEVTTASVNLYTKALERELNLLEAQEASEEKIIQKKKEILQQNLEAAKATYDLNRVKLLDIQGNDSLYESYLRLKAGILRFLGQTKEAEDQERAIAINKKERSAELLKSQAEAEAAIADVVSRSQILQAQVVTKKNNAIKKSNEEAHKERLAAATKHAAELAALQARLAGEALAEQKRLDALELKATEDLISKTRKLREDEELRLAADDQKRLEIKRERDILAIEEEFEKSNRSQEAYIAHLEAIALIDQKFMDDGNNIRIAQEQKKIKSEQDELSRTQKLAEDKRKTEFATAQASVNALQGLSDTFFAVKAANTRKDSAEELKAAKNQFKINKGLSMATAVISGIQGTIAAFSSGSAVPVVGAVLGPLYAVAAAAAAAANIAKIAGTQFTSTTPATPVVGSTPGGREPTSTPTPNIEGQSFNQASVNNVQAVAPSRVYVLEADITGTQNGVATTVSQSQFP
jgi:hypothetical protein